MTNGVLMPEPANRPLVVYKLGGSLLDLPGLSDVLRATVGQRPEHGALLVVGGGTAADVVRDWDRRHHLGDDASHELALEAMRLNEALLQRLIPDLRLVRSARQVELATAAGAIGLFCAHCFLDWAEAAGHPPLPHSWKLTSDSIAAFVAGILNAGELVLLKSVPVPAESSLDQAARAGL
ncbi:MAG TPA: hypothetical protein VL475_02780, partial [Planctomycetaceae bacterium]|nr:hypothetical protein [Planctomycetaceae bacterium]